jgi:hypothetical protein
LIQRRADFIGAIPFCNLQLSIAGKGPNRMTLSMDHTSICGGPAARFAQRLKELIESGYGLCEGEPA